MTVINASAATEAVNITLVSDQFSFASRDASGTNSATQYSSLSAGGDDLQFTGAGIDFNGAPPAFGTATRVDVDLSNNNFANPDVTMTQITALGGGGAIAAARMTALTGSAVDFFNEVMSFNDVMTGSAFNDSFKAGGGSDTLQMGGGADTAYGGDGADSINGDAGNDKLYGDAQNDVLNGGSGQDTLSGGTGADTMNGGFGNDTYVVDDLGDTATDVAFGGVDLVQSSVSYTLTSQIENLTLTGGAAIAGTGNGLNNVLTGNAAANALSGLGGNDTLDGGAGADSMNGGFGDDTYVVDNAGDVAAEVAGGVDLVKSSVSHTLSANLENLTLTGLASVNGTGNAKANVINGNVGANTLTGLGGADTINGAFGSDRLIGGLGADVLNGGFGADRFVFNATAESTSFDQDRILGFDAIGAGAGDLIDVSGIDANAILGGLQAFTYTAGPGGAGTLWVDNSAANSDSIVFANVDGDASAEFQIAIADGATDQSAWVAADFVL